MKEATSYNLYHEDQFDTYYFSFFNKKYPTIVYDDLKSRIDFLGSHGLIDKWVRITPTVIGHYVIHPNRLKIGKIVILVPLIYIYNLAKNLEVFNCAEIRQYTSKLNTDSIDQFSTCYEIEIASNLKRNGFEIDIEPIIETLGKSGRNKKSDLRVKYLQYDIYLEVSSIPLVFQTNKVDPKHRVGDWVTDVRDSIESQKIIGDHLKIDASLIGSHNSILRKDWKEGFMDYLLSISADIKLSRKYHFNGIDFVFKTKSSGDLTFTLNQPFITNILSQFSKKLKQEILQIPKNNMGIIILVLPFIDSACLKYAKSLVNDNLIGIVMITGTDIRIKKYVAINKNLDSNLIELINNQINISCILA